MKTRMDFVTNSSSSSFILAHKPGMSEKQKEAVIQFVEKELLGKEILTPESTEEEIQEVFEEEEWGYFNEDRQKEIREALKSGKSIYSGWVSFEGGYDYAEMLEKVWKLMEENSDGDSIAIDDDLSY